MTVLEIINKSPLALADVADSLKKIKKRDGELNFRAKKVQEYLDSVKPASKKDADALKKKVEALEIPRLKQEHVAKLVDVHPDDMDSLKVLFSNENITIKQEDFDKILAAMKE